MTGDPPKASLPCYGGQSAEDVEGEANKFCRRASWLASIWAAKRMTSINLLMENPRLM